MSIPERPTRKSIPEKDIGEITVELNEINERLKDIGNKLWYIDPDAADVVYKVAKQAWIAHNLFYNYANGKIKT